MRLYFMGGALAALVLLTGCIGGPSAVMTSSGAKVSQNSTGLDNVFYLAHAASQAAPKEVEPANKMVGDGLELVSTNCREYFASAGTTQHWLIASRDGLGLVTTTAITLMTLEGERSRDISKVALTGATGAAAIDLYTRNFLFDADNITGVEALVQKALKAHAAAALQVTSYDYASGVDRIMEAQAICTPRRIAALAKEAIKKGEIETSVRGDSSVEELRDELVLRRLGDELNPPSALTMDEAAGLWWLFWGSPRGDEGPVLIAGKLKGLKGDNNPLDSSGVYKDGWAKRGTVMQTLRTFSLPTRQTFQDAIKARRDQQDVADKAAEAEARRLTRQDLERARLVNGLAPQPRQPNYQIVDAPFFAQVAGAISSGPSRSSAIDVRVK